MWIAFHRSTGNIVSQTFKKKSESRRYIYEKTWATAMFDYRRIRKDQLEQWRAWIKLGLE